MTLTMPPERPERVDRVQLNSKIAVHLRERVDGFTYLYNTTLQAVMEEALAEYMDRRGYTAAEHQRRSKRRG